MVVEQFQIDQLAVLEEVAEGRPLPEVLRSIVEMIERHAPGMLCSILLLARETQSLHIGAGPSLPQSYLAALEGAAIGPQEGSCGAAAALGTRVIVEDISTHPNWIHYRDLALPFGLRACWSSPVLSPQGEVLGTFALYYPEVRGPSKEELQWIDRATHLTAVALSHFRAADELRRSEERARRLARLYAVSSAVHAATVDLQDPAHLWAEACRIAVDQGHTQLAWVAGHDTTADKLVPIAHFGMSAAYLDEISLHLDDPRMKLGPAATAFHAGHPAVVNDISRSPEFFWREAALRNNLRSCAVFPMRLYGGAKGVLAIYADAAHFFLDEEVEVLSNLAKHISYAVETVENRSRSQKLEQQLRQVQKLDAVGQLAGGVAHDFNNLLSVILSYASLLRTKLDSEDPLRAYAEEIGEAGRRAGDLTRQLLAFSRQQMLTPRVISLNHSVTQIHRMLSRIVGDNIEMALHLAPTLGHVLADQGQMEQVLVNLVLNARDAMPSGGSLTIETSNVDFDTAYVATHAGVAPGRYVLLAITDTGVGMDEATRAHVFEPFFTTKGPGKGTGLGLPMVWGIVTQSGGHIWTYSEVGRGTTFKIYLPRVDRAIDAVEEAAPPVRIHGSETLLVVEDAAQVRAIACTILREYGYTVLEAKDGADAVKLCEQHRGTIHLLVTDVVMPRMSGRDLALHLSAVRPDIRVLFISGYAENAIIHHGILDPGIRFLPKPFTPETLLQKVREALDS